MLGGLHLQDSGSVALFQRALFFFESVTHVQCIYIIPTLPKYYSSASKFCISSLTCFSLLNVLMSSISKGKCEAEIEVTVVGAVGSERPLICKITDKKQQQKKIMVGVLKTLKNNMFSCGCDPQVENHHHRT